MSIIEIMKQFILITFVFARVKRLQIIYIFDFFLIYTRFNTFKSLCEFYIIATSKLCLRNVLSYFFLFALFYTQNFFMQELYEQKTFFFSDDFVV